MRHALAFGVITTLLFGLALSGAVLADGDGGASPTQPCRECHPSGSPDFRPIDEGCSCHSGHGAIDAQGLEDRASKLSVDRIHESHGERSNPAADNSNCNEACHSDSTLTCTRCHQSHQEPARNCTVCHGAFPHPSGHEQTLTKGKHRWLGECESCHDGKHVTRYRLDGVAGDNETASVPGGMCLTCHSAANRTHNATRLNGTALVACQDCHDPHSPGEAQSATREQQFTDLVGGEPVRADVFLDLPDLTAFVRTRTGSIASIVGLAVVLAGVYEFAPKSWKDSGPRQVYHQVVSVATTSEHTMELRVTADREAALLVLDYLEREGIDVLASAIDAEDRQLTAVLDSGEVSPETLEGQLEQVMGVEDVDVT